MNSVLGGGVRAPSACDREAGFIVFFPLGRHLAAVKQNAHTRPELCLCMQNTILVVQEKGGEGAPSGGLQAHRGERCGQQALRKASVPHFWQERKLRSASNTWLESVPLAFSMASANKGLVQLGWWA